MEIERGREHDNDNMDATRAYDEGISNTHTYIQRLAMCSGKELVYVTFKHYKISLYRVHEVDRSSAHLVRTS